MATSYMTSTDLIDSIKRRYAVPGSQITFEDNDFLAILNEELTSSLVPEVLTLHEEYFTFSEIIPLVAGKTRYDIPERAIGMKIRSIFYMDTDGNLSEMSQINSDDRDYFSLSMSGNETILMNKFYFEGNEVVLPVYGDFQGAIGSLKIIYYLRPNKLVGEERIAYISSFNKKITITNTNLVEDDTITINGVIFTAKAIPVDATDFTIGATAILTSESLITKINTNGIVSAVLTSGSIILTDNDREYTLSTSNDSAFNLHDLIGCTCTYTSSTGVLTNGIPTNITSTSYVDVLQTRGGHKTYNINVTPSSIVGNIIWFNEDDLDDNVIVNDYISLENECIIPQIPDDLHPMLVQKAASVLLTSLGDLSGAAMSDKKIQELLTRQGNIMDNRATGEPKKIFNKSGFLRNTKRWG